jgi:hypothetical protein
MTLDIVHEQLLEKSLLLEVMLNILSIVIFVPFASYCHRIVIIGGEPEKVGNLNWTMRETRFLGWTLGIYFVSGFALFAGGVFWYALTSVLQGRGLISAIVLFILLVILPGFYLLARLSLVFPGVAVGERPDIGSVWELSEGQVSRLLILVVIFPLLAMITLYGLHFFLLGNDVNLYTGLIAGISFYTLLILVISVLSESYVYLRRQARL